MVHQDAVGNIEITIALVVTTAGRDALETKHGCIVDVVVTVAVGSRVSKTEAGTVATGCLTHCNDRSVMHPEVALIRIDRIDRGLGVVTSRCENQRVVERNAACSHIRIVVWRVHLDDHVAQILPGTGGTHVVSKLFNRATGTI